MRIVLRIAIGLFCIFLGITSAMALPSVSVDTDPSTPGIQSDLEIAVGNSFTVDVVVKNVDTEWPLNVFEFHLNFDPSILIAASVVSGGFLPQPSLILRSDITPPDVYFVEGVLGPGTAAGDGILATITFDAIGLGTSALDLNDVILAALGGIDITGAVNDGTVTVTPPTEALATLSLNPATKTITVGDTFDVDVILDTGGHATDGIDIRFLRYNPDVLEVQDSDPTTPVVQIQPGTLFPNTPTNRVDVANGTIGFSQSSYAGSPFTGSGTLATITFKAIAADEAELTFDFSPGSTRDTNDASDGIDVLASVTGAHFTSIVIIPGDLNGDGDVDYDDYLIFRTAYRSCDGDPNYIPGADLDEDGCVTINDYRIFRSLI